MFRIIYCQDREYGTYRILARAETLEEARALRKVAGDIVIDDNDKVVTDRAWLFPWEVALGGAKPSKYTSARRRNYALTQIMWQEDNPNWRFLWHKKEIS